MAEHFRFDIAQRDADTFDLLHDDVILISYASGGETAALSDSACERFRVLDLARWGAPFALAGLGIVFLHAATVERGGITVCIMGEGGAGKSTLARGFTRLGWTMVSDDMIACDAVGRIGLSSERVLRGWAAEVERGQVLQFGELARRVCAESDPWRPLRVLLFLGKRTQGDWQLSTVSCTQTFEHLTKLGFGNVPIRSAWANQMRAHAALSSIAEGARLSLPDGLERLDSALPALEQQLLRRVTTGEETG